MKRIKIPKLKIEVQTEISQKGVAFEDIKIPKGWRLLKVEEMIYLHNNLRYRKALNLIDTWEFLQQPLK